MVKVQITRHRDGHVLTFLADGHAESSRRRTEYDLVCAAISAVMQTALLGLGEYVGLKDRLTYNMDDDGWLYCKLPLDLSDAEQVRADAIMETMIIGLQSIRSQYPKQITVEEEVE